MTPYTNYSSKLASIACSLALASKLTDESHSLPWKIYLQKCRSSAQNILRGATVLAKQKKLKYIEEFTRHNKP